MQGRADDVINIAGHRIGSAEVEAAFSAHPAVCEVAVIGVADRIKGEAAKAFVVLNDGFEPSDGTIKELKRTVRNELGPVAVIKSVEFRQELPKTRSGKILRRVLKAEETGTGIGDLTGVDED
jgi:acetyl-CoA synthetase